MRSVAQWRINPSDSGLWVLRASPECATAEQAARVIEQYLERKRPALAGMLEIKAEEGSVILRARGEAPEETLREARELLASARDVEPAGEIEVDAREFAIEAVAAPEDAWEEPEILRSRARYFPYPVCEWFEISTGDLVLTESRVVFEPEQQIMREAGAGPGGERRILLAEISRSWRGEWWDIPCLMLETRERVYRYGWPAERGELGTIFDVDEWLTHLRTLFGRWT